ncbi:uncharacterized protein PRCAT00003466001 [Priceomyces carsonii]|uniref:uncharacterized protein n=1 Tax=Priceomyces carsonii TaxID=28549 RepID=UPI002EDBB05F|nr:unnamed protein product [Priceomyces carsonii]
MCVSHDGNHMSNLKFQFSFMYCDSRYKKRNSKARESMISIKSMDNNQPRRRIRTRKACGPCREKKIRCDALRPFCSNCSSQNIVNLCHYQRDPWMDQLTEERLVKENISKKIKYLNEQIKMLELELDPSDSLGKQNSNKKIGNGFAQEEEEEEDDDDDDDVALNLEKGFSFFIVKHSRLRYFGPTSHVFFLLNDEYARVIFERYLNDQVRAFGLKRKSNNEPSDINISDESAIMISNSSLSRKLVLPPLKVIRLLINRFFAVCYPLFPLVEERAFKRDLLEILKDVRLNLDELPQRDSSAIAMLLVILRLAYSTLSLELCNDGMGLDSELIKEIIFNYGISSSFIEYADAIVLSMRNLQRISAREIQATMLLLCYKMHSPDNDDCGTEAGLLLGMAVQMAKLCGLDRMTESSKDPLIISDEYELKKILWSYLLYYDASISFSLGVPLSVSDAFSTDSSDNIFFTSRKSHTLLLNDEARVRGRVTKILRRAVQLTSKSSLKPLRSSLEKIYIELQMIINEDLLLFGDSNIFDVSIADKNYHRRLIGLKFKIDLHLKSYAILCILYLTSDRDREKSLRDSYFQFALQESLIILHQGVKFVNNSLEQTATREIVASYFVDPLFKVIPFISSLMLQESIIEGCLFEYLSQIKSREVSRFLMQVGIELNGSEDIIDKFNALFEDLSKKSSKLVVDFLCRRGVSLVWTCRIVLDYFGKNSSDPLCEYENSTE